MKWTHAACVGRNQETDESPEDIEDNRCRNRVDRIDAALHLWIGPGKIDHRLIAFDLYPDTDCDGLVRDAVVVEKIFRFVRSIGNDRNGVPGHALAVVENLGYIAAYFIPSIFLDHLHQATLAGAVRAQHGGEVAFTFLRCSDIRKNKVPHVRVELAAGHQLDGRNSKTLLVDFLGERHGAGRHTADVRMMCPACDVEDELLPGEHAGDQSDVRQVSSAFVGVIEDHDVAWADVAVLDRRLYG